MPNNTDTVPVNLTEHLKPQPAPVDVPQSLLHPRGNKRQIPRNGGKIEFLALTPTIRELFGKGFDAWKIHAFLREQHRITMSYRTFARYFRQFKMKTQPESLLQAEKRPLLRGSNEPPGRRFQYTPPSGSLEGLV